MIVTIDGPAGAGKSTVAAELAKRLGCRYLNSGVTYRAVGWAALEKGVAPNQERAVKELMRDLRVSLEYPSWEAKVSVNGQDVTDLLQTREVSEAASLISRFPFVRKKVVAVQRNTGRAGDLVAEGRDMGTVVFPDAEVKFFLEASPEVRARRRLQDWDRLGVETNYQEVLAELGTRDERDSTRQASPLRPAEDAVRVDTSNLTVDEVVSLLLDRIGEESDAADMV